MIARLVAVGVLAIVPACHFGVSYSSQWTSLHAKSGVEIGGDDPTGYPDYRGAVRMNVVTISDDSGWLRAAAIAAGSAVEESSRREAEARATGGTYHARSIGVPEVVPGGRTRFAVAWGRSDAWSQKYLAYTDSISPRQIGDSAFYWSVEGHVLFGSIQHAGWESSDLLFRAQLGPVFGRTLGTLGPLELSARIGALIDPVFKPVAYLIIGGDLPGLDVTTYAQIDAIAAGHVTLGGRVAYDRGQGLSPSSSTSALVTAGVVF